MRSRYIAVLALATALLTSAAASGATTYEVQDLAITAGLRTSTAYDVNNSGTVVGHSSRTGRSSAYTWNAVSGFVDLGTLPTGTSSWAGRINNSGAAAGWSWTDNSGTLHAVRWLPGSAIEDLGSLPGSTTSDLMDLNDLNMTCGDASINGFSHAVFWDAAGTIFDIGCLPGDDTSYAQALDNSGLVVGYSFSRTDFISDMFLWTVDGGIMNAGRPQDAKSASPWGMNNLGQVFGHWSPLSGGTMRSFLWSADGGFVDSAMLGMSEISAINDRGQLAGKDLDGRLVVRNADGSMSYLPSVPSAANAYICNMNNNGWVAGFATMNSTTHAVLWTPVPEPSSILALISGIAGTGWMMLRRRR